METKKQYFKSIVIEPIKNNLSIVLLWGGVFLTFLGAVFGTKIDSFGYIPSGTGEAILKSGSAILGAGVFAVIMKSSQFTELFQKHILNVMYSPSNLKDKDDLKEKWKFLTNEMLKYVLPQAHSDATKHIEKQFFNSELEYHFENHEITYEVIVKDNIATVKNTTRTTIVLSPNIENPIFEQKFWNNGKSKLCKLFLGGKNINKDGMFKVDSKDPTLNILTFPFKEYDIISNVGEDTKVSFERMIENSQDLSDDPMLMSRINRYAKGFVVKAKISDGYKLVFENFGYNDILNNYEQDDGDGFERWQLAKPNELLLPGDGYVIAITM